MKIPLYCRCGIAEVWLVDVQKKALTVYLSPGPDGYLSVSEVTSGSIHPDCLPDVLISLPELFG